jgi:hypothetical protein
MQKELGKDFTDRSQREAFLKDNCDKVEEKGYMKPFTSDELQGRKENLAILSIQIDEIEAEKKAQARYFKNALEPLTKQRKEMVDDIRQKSKYVNEICYKFVDDNERMVGYYNAEGDLIESRPATADELQPSMFTIIRKNAANS